MKVFKVNIDDRLGETILVAAEDYGGAERVTKKVKGGFVRIAGIDCLGNVEMDKESKEYVKTMLEYDAQDEGLDGYLNPGDRIDHELFLLIGKEGKVEGLPTHITQGGKPQDFGDGIRMRMTAVYLGNEVYRYVGYMPEFGTGKEEPRTRTLPDFEAQDKDADEWLEVGDLVEERLFLRLAEAVPPSYMSKDLTQCGDPIHETNGIPCYMTFSYVDKKGYVYLGVLPEFKIGGGHAMRGIDYLDIFASLPPINMDRILNGDTSKDDTGGYVPMLYGIKGVWHVTIVHVDTMTAPVDFTGKTPEEVIDKVYGFYKKKELL